MAYVEVMCGQTRDDELERGGDVAGQSGTARILAGVHRQWLRRAGRLSTDRLTRPRCYRCDVTTPDLDAIGVTLPADRARFLSAVDQLQTAVLTTSSTSCVSGSATAPVYFTLENPDTTTSNLTTVVSERLSDDGIALSAEPYTSHLSAEPYTTQVNSHDCGHGPQCPRSTSRKQVHARRGG